MVTDENEEKSSVLVVIREEAMLCEEEVGKDGSGRKREMRTSGHGDQRAKRPRIRGACEVNVDVRRAWPPTAAIWIKASASTEELRSAAAGRDGIVPGCIGTMVTESRVEQRGRGGKCWNESTGNREEKEERGEGQAREEGPRSSSSGGGSSSNGSSMDIGSQTGSKTEKKEGTKRFKANDRSFLSQRLLHSLYIPAEIGTREDLIERVMTQVKRDDVIGVLNYIFRQQGELPPRRLRSRVEGAIDLLVMALGGESTS